MAREAFQVVKIHGADEGAKAYTVANLRGETDRLGFSQPVAHERLVLVNVLPEKPVSGGEPVKLKFSDRGMN